jgi:hypothetical protein
MEGFDVEFNSVSRLWVRGDMGDCELSGFHSVQHDILLLKASHNLKFIVITARKVIFKINFIVTKQTSLRFKHLCHL